MGGIIFCRRVKDGRLGEKEMPIQVQGPDNQLYEFPDGTPNEVMTAAMRKRYGGPASKVYQVEAPDGSTFRVEAPEGATEDEVLAYAQANWKPRQKLSEVTAASADARRTLYEVELPSGEILEVDAPEGTPEHAVRNRAHAYLNDQQAGASKTRKLSEVNGFSEREELEGLRRLASLEDKAAGKPNFSNVRGGSKSSKAGYRPYAQYSGPLLKGDTSAMGAPSLDAINAANLAKRNAPGFAAGQQRAATANKRQQFQSLPAPARFMVGMGQRVAQTGRGLQQGIAWGADQFDPQDRIAQAMAAEAEARQRDAYMRGDTAATLGGIAGDIGLTMAPAGAVGRLGGVRGIAASGALGGAYAGLQPVVEGESRMDNAGMGAAFGAGGQALGAGLSAWGRNAARAVPKDIRAMTARATDMGIPVHASQVSQSLPVKVAASAGKYLPFSGYAKAASAQQTGINRAVAKTFGADADKLSDDVMLEARRRLNTGFEEVYNRNAVPLTQAGVRKLAQVESAAMRRLTVDDAQVLRNQLDDILANADDGVLTGQKYQAVRTELKKAEGPDKLGQAVKEIRQALDDIAAEAVGPQDAAKLKSLRSQWANFRTAEGALKQNAGAGGDIKLASLWPLIRKGSTKEMRELARMGQTLLKDPIADSGTAQRTFAYNLLMGGGSIANPALIPMFAKASLGGATLGRMANSSALARLLARDNRGVGVSKLGALLEGAYPYVAPALANYDAGGGR